MQLGSMSSKEESIKLDNLNVKASVMSEHVFDWTGWLKEGSFYVHGMVYMLVRIAVNVTIVRINFFALTIACRVCNLSISSMYVALKRLKKIQHPFPLH